MRMSAKEFTILVRVIMIAVAYRIFIVPSMNVAILTVQAVTCSDVVNAVKNVIA